MFQAGGDVLGWEGTKVVGPGVEWKMGGNGQSCSTVCSNAGLMCSDATFPQQLSQAVTDALFASVGRSCSSKSSTSSASAPYYYNNYCYRGTGTSSCSSYSSSYSRLCPCSGAPSGVLGGYNQLSRASYLRKTFSGLCTHREMSLVFSLVPIGWQGESAMLYVDGVLVWSESSFSANTVLVVPHSERQMTVEFRTTISSGATGLNRSWGLSRFDAAAQCSGQVRDMLQWLLPCQTWVSSSPCSVS